MALRWYTLVVDCHDVAAQAWWWAQVMDWKIVHQADDEAVILPSWVTLEMLDEIPWERQGPGMVFVPVPEGKSVKNRLHIDLAPHTSQDRAAEIQRLLDLGATRVDVGQDDGEAVATWVVLADPEGNEFCVLSSRDR
jgi:catechol 2,3-dioxygenase-like lactoylglutathione lyase family enzyme